jgi:hypothetical protein
MGSVVGNARRGHSATPLAFSAKTPARTHPEKQKTFCTEGRDFQSPWKSNNSSNRAQDAAEEQTPKDTQSTEAETTVMRACPGK